MSGLSKQKEPIRGWLIVGAVSLWIGPFYSIFEFTSGISHLYLHQPLVYINVVDGLVKMIISPIFITLFIRRKAAFIKLSIMYLIYVFLVEIALLVAYIQLRRNLILNFLGFIEVIVIFLYLLRSKRVKRTFVM